MALAGCISTYQLKDRTKSAELIIAGESNSTSTTYRVLYAQAFQDEDCRPNENGTHLNGKLSHEGSEPVLILAEADFVFTVRYSEARFSQTRRCAITAKFRPSESHRYKAKLVSLGEVDRCFLSIFDVTTGTDEQVAFTMPAHACTYEADKPPNGQPQWTIMNYRVILIPSR